MNPATTAEAWNVIRLSRANVERLLQESRLSEVANQVALCSPALRFLSHTETSPEAHQIIDTQTARAFQHVNTVAQSAMVQSQSDADKAFVGLQSALTALAAAFDPKDVAAEIYYCPTHSEFTATEVGSVCPKCSSAFRLRRIPYSFVYVAPMKPTVKLTVEKGGPLLAGQKAEFKMKLATMDGTPLSAEDFLIVHSQPIHLIIADGSLRSYHTAIPERDSASGTYTFSFTPMSSSPHRLWADIVPISTGLEELPFADLGGDYVPLSTKELPDTLTAKVGGFNFQFTFNTGQASAKKIQMLSVIVTDSADKPVQRLEPLMNAFAQVVGFYDDHQTVLRVHPAGGDILGEELRGGPGMNFKLYPPKVGFIQFYCQVKIDGKTITAPFSVNVAN